MTRNPNEPAKEVSFWLSEINSCKKREDDYRKDGERILEIYSGKKAATTPFNILFSNTETLLPALYSAVPKPVVQRRFKDADPLGKNAADAGARVLEFLVDTNVDGYETFDEGMRAGVLDALLPGRGVTCVKYDAEVGGEVDSEYKKSELVCLESVVWNRVFFGYAKKWSNVPWVAYEKHIDQEEALRLFGEEVTKFIDFTDQEDDEDKEDNEDKGERKTACVYQIWDKSGGKKVRWVSAQYKDGYLKVDDDPLQLTGFFNIPKPIQFIEKSSDIVPVALYVLYETQAKELNEVTLRIKHITKAIKARGVYDAELGDDLANIMKADDNELIPSDKTASLAAEKGLSNAIWFLPIEQLIAVLMQLYQARENCKQVIYEITGIADIMRGASNASETLGAQQIKQSWGTLRLKRVQKEVQRYARDLLRMMLEVAATKFNEETWAKMTGMPFMTSEQKAKLQQVAQGVQQAQAEGRQIPPEAMEQIQQAMQTPVWTDILAILKDDMQRAYRIDIETNSTVEPEAVEDQKNIQELMAAMSQLLNGLAPLVADGIMPYEAAQAMLLVICRRYRFGTEIEDLIKQMKPPQPKDDGSAEAQAKQAEQQAAMQADQDKMQLEHAKLQASSESEAANIQKEKDLEALRLQHAAEVEQFKAQSAKELKGMELASEESLKLAIADRDNAAKVEIARIQAQATESTAAHQAAAQRDTAIATTQSDNGLQELTKAVQELIAMKSQPIKIDRHPDGKPKAVNGRQVSYGADGRIEGLH